MTSTDQTEWHDPKSYLETRLNVKDTSLPFDIPVLDIGPTFGDAHGREEVAQRVRDACMTSGFFYITNHGIPNSACQAVLSQAKRLFCCLNDSQKHAIHIERSPYGYGWEDSTTTSINGDVERKEAFNWTYEDDFDLDGGDGQYVQLDGRKVENPNQWPEEDDLPGFRDGVGTYYGHALKLARHLCRLFALSLGLSEDHFDAMITHPSANGRIMYYPEATSRTSSSNGIGLGAHSDYQCFTILLPSSTPGLEILSPAGQWMKAPFVENGLIVNIGDMMMRWTNGLYKSTVHRVINHSATARYSVPLFFGPNNDAMVETLPTCVTADRPSQFPPVLAGDYIIQRLAATRMT